MKFDSPVARAMWAVINHELRELEDDHTDAGHIVEAATASEVHERLRAALWVGPVPEEMRQRVRDLLDSDASHNGP